VETKSKFIEPFFVEPNVELTPYVLKHTLVPVVGVNSDLVHFHNQPVSLLILAGNRLFGQTRTFIRKFYAIFVAFPST
jgi:hypothetical protein